MGAVAGVLEIAYRKWIIVLLWLKRLMATFVLA